MSIRWAITTGDFNGDGKTDLVVANAGDATLSILPGNGDGTFRAAVNYTTGTMPCSIASVDFNGDGVIDLALPNRGDGTVGINFAITAASVGASGFPAAVLNAASAITPQTVAPGVMLRFMYPRWPNRDTVLRRPLRSPARWRGRSFFWEVSRCRSTTRLLGKSTL